MNWGYVIAAWAVSVAVLVGYTIAILAKGRALSRRVAPERRRWM